MPWPRLRTVGPEPETAVATRLDELEPTDPVPDTVWSWRMFAVTVPEEAVMVPVFPVSRATVPVPAETSFAIVMAPVLAIVMAPPLAVETL